MMRFVAVYAVIEAPADKRAGTINTPYFMQFRRK